MKRYTGWLWVAMAMWLAGCTTPENRLQVHVIGRPALRGLRMPVTSADRDAVKEIVRTVATQLKCVERTATSFNPNVIASFAQEDKAEPYFVDAYAYQDFIVVDLRHETSSLGESRSYERVKEALAVALKNKFGNRAITPAQIDQVRNIVVPAPVPPATP